MSKISVFLSRLATGSVKRMFQYVNIIHNDTGKNRVGIFLDMAWCIVRYDIGYLEYRVFDFAHIRGAKKRSTFMTMNHNQSLCRMVNDRDYAHLFADKLAFNQTFADCLGRDCMDIHQANAQQLRSFCAGKDSVFAKATDKFGGQGMEKIAITANTDYDKLLAQLQENHQWLLEDLLIQHPDMAKLCAASVNTIRIVTLLMPQGAQMVYALLRMGNGTKAVDNISSGGMYTWVDQDGVLRYPAFCDKTGMFYDAHPATGTVFQGYQIPYFQEAVQLCLDAAQRVPQMRYIGWDVAITPNGPVFVEGNNLPGYDMAQNGRFHTDGTGILPIFEEILGSPIPKNYQGPAQHIVLE